MGLRSWDEGEEASHLSGNKVKIAEPRAHLKMTRRAVGDCENPLQGTHSQYRHRAGPSASADQVVSDFAGGSLQLSEFLAFSVIKHTQGSGSRDVWVPTDVGGAHRCESTTTDVDGEDAEVESYLKKWGCLHSPRSNRVLAEAGGYPQKWGHPKKWGPVERPESDVSDHGLVTGSKQ